MDWRQVLRKQALACLMLCHAKVPFMLSSFLPKRCTGGVNATCKQEHLAQICIERGISHDVYPISQSKSPGSAAISVQKSWPCATPKRPPQPRNTRAHGMVPKTAASLVNININQTPYCAWNDLTAATSKTCQADPS